MTNDILNTKNFDNLIDATLQQQTSGCYYRQALYALFMHTYVLSKKQAMDYIKERFAGLIESTTNATGKGFAGVMSKEFTTADEWLRSADGLNYFTLDIVNVSDETKLAESVFNLANHLQNNKVNYRNTKTAREREQKSKERAADKASKQAEADEARQAQIQADEAERVAGGYDNTDALQAIRWYSKLTDSDKVKVYETLEKQYKQALTNVRKAKQSNAKQSNAKQAKAA